MEIDVPGGFSGVLSLWYSSSGGTLTTRVSNDVNLEGTILGEIDLLLTASGGFTFSQVLFEAQEKPVGFATHGTAGFYLYNVTLQKPHWVPPDTFLVLSSALLLACGSSALGRRKAHGNFTSEPDFRSHPLRAVWRRVLWRLHWRFFAERPVVVKDWWRGMQITLPRSGSAAHTKITRQMSSGITDHAISSAMPP